MIDVFMIFTMTIPLLEIIGHTYAEHLRLKMIELDELSDPQKLPLTSSNASVSIQPLGLEGSKLDLPLVKSKLFANDKRSKLSRKVEIHLTYPFLGDSLRKEPSFATSFRMCFSPFLRRVSHKHNLYYLFQQVLF